MLDRAKGLAAEADTPKADSVEDRLTKVERVCAELMAIQKKKDEQCEHFWVPFGQQGGEMSCVHCWEMAPKGTKLSRLNHKPVGRGPGR